MNISINIKVSKAHEWSTSLAQCDDVERLKSFVTFVLSDVKRSTRELRDAESACRRAEGLGMRREILKLCQEVEDEFKEMAFWGDLSVPRRTDLHKKWAEWWGPVAEAPKWVKKPESSYSVKFSKTERPCEALRDAVDVAVKTILVLRATPACDVQRDGVPILHVEPKNNYYHPWATYGEMNEIGTNFPAFRGIKRKEHP